MFRFLHDVNMTINKRPANINFVSKLLCSHSGDDVAIDWAMFYVTLLWWRNHVQIDALIDKYQLQSGLYSGMVM